MAFYERYKDSLNTGLGFLLALAAAWIDMIWVRSILGILAATFLIWPLLHRRWNVTPAMVLGAVGVGSFAVAVVWQIFFGGGASGQRPADYSPYDLTPEKKRVIAQMAIAPDGHANTFQIITINGCGDCLRFSDEFVDLINKLPGWNITSVGEAYGTTQRIRGIQFEVQDVNNQPASALVMQKAFQKADIEFTVGSGFFIQSSFHPRAYEFLLYLGPYLNGGATSIAVGSRRFKFENVIFGTGTNKGR